MPILLIVPIPRKKTLGWLNWLKAKHPCLVLLQKADKIFDLLLQEGHIKLQAHHRIPSPKELKKIRYCKWHNATSHDTNDCKVFRQQIQSAIE